MPTGWHRSTREGRLLADEFPSGYRHESEQQPMQPLPYPRIELHVHLEGTIRPHTLLELARANDLPLPVSTPEELAALYRYRDFDHFIETWILTTNVTRRADDFRRVLVEYAAEAASHGAVYVEGCFTPGDRAARGVP